MKEVLKAPIHCLRLLFLGSITFETSVVLGANGDPKSPTFQTIMEFNGDTLNKIPYPGLFTDSEWKKAWADAAERHLRVTRAGSRYIALFPRCVYWLAVVCIVGLIINDLLAPLFADHAEFVQNALMPARDLTTGTAPPEKIYKDLFQLARGPCGVLLLFFRGKLISLLLKIALAISRSILWTWIKKSYNKILERKKSAS